MNRIFCPFLKSQLSYSKEDHVHACGRLHAVSGKLLKPWSIQFRGKTKPVILGTVSGRAIILFRIPEAVDVPNIEEASKKVSSWQRVTLRWLSQSSLFHPSLLPKMKVPGTLTGRDPRWSERPDSKSSVFTMSLQEVFTTTAKSTLIRSSS